MIGTRELTEFAAVDVHSEEDFYTVPLKRSALALLAQAPDEVVLLGSVATGKYLDPLLPIFGERLRFPLEFKGRGDMSRGALMLRSVAAETELQYGPIPVLPRRVRLRPAGRAA